MCGSFLAGFEFCNVGCMWLCEVRDGVCDVYWASCVFFSSFFRVRVKVFGLVGWEARCLVCEAEDEVCGFLGYEAGCFV